MSTSEEILTGVESRHAVFPPVVESAEIIGYVKDWNGCNYSRDIGRSFVLAGNIYYLFGDTFCKDSTGEFVGLVSNSATRLLDKANPEQTFYENVGSLGVVKPFLELDEDEMDYQHDNRGKRVTLWPFGGAVEPVCGTAMLWYQKGIDSGNGNNEYCGAGVAKVELHPSTYVFSGFILTLSNILLSSLDNNYPA